MNIPRNIHPVWWAATCLMLLVLGGCGGGQPGPVAAAPGTGGTGSYTVGPISGFGSIIINGVRYDDSSAVVVTDDGESSDDDKGTLDSSDLQLGMIAEVEGSTVTLATSGGLASANANTIRLTHQLRGPVSAVNAAQGTLTLLSQTVKVNPATVLANVSSLAAANPTNCAYAEVYAFLDALNKRYVATRVACRSTQPTTYRIFGMASGVTASSFNLLGLTVNKGAASMAGIEEGSLVRAVLRNTLSGSSQNLGTAVRLSVGATGVMAGSTDARLEGLISSFGSNRSFAVNGVPVVTDNSTVFEGGTALGLGMRVEIDGELRDGVLWARRVELEDEDELAAEGSEFFGRVSQLDALAGTFVLTTRADRVFEVRYGPDDVRSGDESLLVNGVQVELKGTLDSQGNTITATHVEVETD